ncbi:putative 5-formyltetrahydrofolate cyclo-ligase [Tribonema minus]|uniref:5-formyltetrahydrofolate cyclo-ligase n=1 Tax=Tribonema minus TaxID=303371 RepID=A0A835ZF18_9STRA|nr:putative 5-formyltetrahydrofolate cyclo-ligase [Tribonema minus]
MTTIAAEGSIVSEKAALRSAIKTALGKLEKPAIAASSEAILGHLKTLPCWSKSSVVSAYLSMPREAQTMPIMDALFTAGKRVYVPKVVGPDPSDMRMYQIESMGQIESFPLTKWNIPEPSLEAVLAAEDGTTTGDIDLVILPGCAFDARCNRLGHGKGYYDSFLKRCFAAAKARGNPIPVTVGICLEEQVVPSVPVTDHDVPLDFVVTPEQVFANPLTR